MKKMNNKGFSLIELIIVIAIMAVLVAVIAPNLTGYIGKSKESTDKSNADTMENVISNALQDFTTDSDMLYDDSTAVDSTNTSTIESTLKGWTKLNDLMKDAATDASKAHKDAKGNEFDTFLTNVYKSLEKYAEGTNKDEIKCKVTANTYWMQIKGTYDDGFTCEIKAAKNDPFTR